MTDTLTSTYIEKLGPGGMCSLWRRIPDYSTIQNISVFIMHNMGGEIIGELSLVAVIGEEDAAVVSFCRLVNHSETLILAHTVHSQAQTRGKLCHPSEHHPGKALGTIIETLDSLRCSSQTVHAHSFRIPSALYTFAQGFLESLCSPSYHFTERESIVGSICFGMIS